MLHYTPALYSGKEYLLPPVPDDKDALCYRKPDKPPLPLSMVGSIVRINVSERQRLKSLAVRFQRWLQTRDDRNVWLKVDEQGGVPAVGVWIFHILLERNRLIRAEQ